MNIEIQENRLNIMMMMMMKNFSFNNNYKIIKIRIVLKIKKWNHKMMNKIFNKIKI
jgi:hypothetical protein